MPLPPDASLFGKTGPKEEKEEEENKKNVVVAVAVVVVVVVVSNDFLEAAAVFDEITTGFCDRSGRFKNNRRRF